MKAPLLVALFILTAFGGLTFVLTWIMTKLFGSETAGDVMHPYPIPILYLAGFFALIILLLFRMWRLGKRVGRAGGG